MKTLDYEQKIHVVSSPNVFNYRKKFVVNVTYQLQQHIQTLDFFPLNTYPVFLAGNVFFHRIIL
jgi:hypothetical protein